MTNLEHDLATRWTPSPEQDEAAAQALALGAGKGEGVYTVHVLVNKSHGFWTEDVEVVPAVDVAGVFESRETALVAVEAAAKAKHEETGLPVSGGYTWHRPAKGEPQTTADGREWKTAWAVWEDICSEFPVPQWRLEARAARAAAKAAQEVFDEPEIDDQPFDMSGSTRGAER